MRSLALWLLLVLQGTDPAAEGLKALQERRYDAAAEAFRKALQADPADYGAHFHLALAHSLLGRDTEAVAGYRKVLELKPGLYEAELNLGIVLVRIERPAEALALLEAAARKKPKEYRPQFHLGEALLAAGEAARAEASYQLATEIDPAAAPARLGLARAMARQNRLEEAAAHFRRAAGMDPAFREALLELAGLYEKNNRPAEAIAIYEEFPGQPAVGERLGALLLESGRAAEAVPRLEAAVRTSPTPANRFALATAYLRTRQPDKAGPLLEAAVAAEPDNPGLRLTLGRVLRDQKNYAAAAREFFRVTRAQPHSREAWSELAGMLILLENFPEALAALDRLEALGETGASLHYFRAIVLDRTRQPRPALESYRKFLASSQGHPDEEFKARQRVRILEKEVGRR